MKRAAIVSALLIAILVLTAGLAPIMAEPADRVLIEVAPGKMAGMAQAVRRAGGTVHFEFPDLNVLAVTLPASGVERMRNNPNVVSIEEDPVRYPMGDGDGQVVPYGIDMVQAPLVWAEGVDGEGVTVCVIDTGLYWEHEDIPDNANGFSQIPGEEWFTDGYGHGTHVAGTITALDNELGVIGVSPGKVNLFMVKIFDNAGEWVSKAHASNLAAAAQTCAENGAQIISMSLGGGQPTGLERRTFDALYEQGILSVASAGNDATSDYNYPASYDSVISVAAIDSNYAVADFSQFNDQVELAAPGVGVLSTVPYISLSKLTVDGVDYEALHMEFAPYTPEGGVSSTLVDGGLCQAADPVADWSGKVVLCERGVVSFAEKVTKVKDSGGLAAVVYNNVDEGAVSGTLGEEGDWLYSIGITQADGQYLVANKLGVVGTVLDVPPIVGSGYEAWNGTSMSAPHVSGVAALLWSSNPDLTNVQIREAMALTAIDLGAEGRDINFGYGLVQAYDALEYLQGITPGQGPKGPNK